MTTHLIGVVITMLGVAILLAIDSAAQDTARNRLAEDRRVQQRGVSYILVVLKRITVSPTNRKPGR